MASSPKTRAILRASIPFAALLAHPLSLHAQEHAVDLDTIVVLGTDRRQATQLDVPSNTTIIDGKEIEARNISDISELVRTIPGVTVGRQTGATDPFSTFGGISIRGVGGNRVQLQIDGSRMSERIIDGTRDYFDFNFTKQVEIVRGPASILWGADALGGVVALQTIDPEDVLQGRERGGNVRLGFDSLDDSKSSSLNYAQKLSPEVDVLIGYSRTSAHETKFSNARSDGGIYGCPRNLAWGATPCNELDPTDNTSYRVLAKLVWKPNGQNRFEFSTDILNRDTDVQYNYSLGPVVSNLTGKPTGEIIRDYDRNLDLTRERHAIEHLWTPSGGFLSALKTTLAFAPHGYTRTGVETSTSAGGDEIITYDRLRYAEDFIELDIQATSEFATGTAEHSLIYGFDGDYAKTDYARRDLINNLSQGTLTERRAGGFNFANADTTRADLYVEDRITFGASRFELTPGLRYATYEIDPQPDSDYKPVEGYEPRKRTNEELLKSLGALYRFDETYSVWAKYGEGFKMPTAQQLFTSLPGRAFDLIPAPNLKPEEVKSYEIGVRGEYARGYFALNAFNADYTSFIQSFYNPPGTSVYTYRNISSVDVWGLEASGEWKFDDLLTGGFAASGQKGRQRAAPDEEKTPHTLPPLTATVSLTREFPRYDLRLMAIGVFAAEVEDTEDPDDFKPSGYGLLDLNAQWKVIKNGVVNFSLTNAFDTRYFTANAANYSINATDSVARSNPIELQTGAGRAFAVSFNLAF